jgi:HD superfamily phosphohydrolase
MYKKQGLYEDYIKEEALLRDLFSQIKKSITSKYSLIAPLGVGGTGVTVSVLDNSLKVKRALKVPRPIQGIRIELVENEMHTLLLVRHPYIIPIYYHGSVLLENKQFPFFIMSFVDDVTDLGKWLKKRLTTIKKPSELRDTICSICTMYYKIASALEELHSLKLIHFDVKPSNILVDPKENVYLSDFGFTKRKSGSRKHTDVRYTRHYAHPHISDRSEGGESSNLQQSRIAPYKFRYEWDLYAFGRSILESLSEIAEHFSDELYKYRLFECLHLIACRLLDGQNRPDSDVSKAREDRNDSYRLRHYFEEWQCLNRDALGEKGIAYSTIAEAREDFAKSLRSEWYIDAIPELDDAFAKRIQCSDDVTAAFTYRVKKLIEHPVVARMSAVHQLQLCREVYPTANHTRLEHSLGVYANCCQYIKSLCNDPYNPLFSHLMNVKELKAIIVASLLHDLGHYSFAHELEDIPGAFNHQDLSAELLSTRHVDRDGDMLREIVENDKWGWALKMSDVSRLISRQNTKRSRSSSNLKNVLLASIIDGPLDVDKLDYLVRDSKNCGLPYGAVIDSKRLIRNLTTHAYWRHGVLCAEICAYEKGLTAAESFMFARYLLYQTVYWHHTVRAGRTMLLEAARAAYANGNGQKIEDDIRKLIGLGQRTKCTIISVKSVLEVLHNHTTRHGRQLIEQLMMRRYFKRILTVHYDDPPEYIESFNEKLRSCSKEKEFLTKLRIAIKRRFTEELKSHGGNVRRLESATKQRVKETETLLDQSHTILIDVSMLGPGSKRPLTIIPEPDRLRRVHSKRFEASGRIAKTWGNVLPPLFNCASKIRIYCHPEMRGTLMSVLDRDKLREVLSTVVDSYESTGEKY